MTIAVIWQEDDFLWCAADTRLVTDNDRTTTEIAAKIYSIPVATAAMGEGFARQPHYWTQYGFVYAGVAFPATMTAITASTLLQKLARPGDRTNPPRFEDLAEFVLRLATRFMKERREFKSDGLFSAALFGWCPYEEKYKVAYVDGRDDGGSFRVELTYPPTPTVEGDPWLVFGSASTTFASTISAYKKTEKHVTKKIPRRVINEMVSKGTDPAVGGAISIGMAHRHGFELYYSLEPVMQGKPEARRIFNGLDLDAEVGSVGEYFIAIDGLA